MPGVRARGAATTVEYVLITCQEEEEEERQRKRLIMGSDVTAYLRESEARKSPFLRDLTKDGLNLKRRRDEGRGTVEK